jgi:hypothetical protein
MSEEVNCLDCEEFLFDLRKHLLSLVSGVCGVRVGALHYPFYTSKIMVDGALKVPLLQS